MQMTVTQMVTAEAAMTTMTSNTRQTDKNKRFYLSLQLSIVLLLLLLLLLFLLPLAPLLIIQATGSVS